MFLKEISNCEGDNKSFFEKSGYVLIPNIVATMIYTIIDLFVLTKTSIVISFENPTTSIFVEKPLVVIYIGFVILLFTQFLLFGLVQNEFKLNRRLSLIPILVALAFQFYF